MQILIVKILFILFLIMWMDALLKKIMKINDFASTGKNREI